MPGGRQRETKGKSHRGLGLGLSRTRSSQVPEAGESEVQSHPWLPGTLSQKKKKKITGQPHVTSHKEAKSQPHAAGDVKRLWSLPTGQTQWFCSLVFSWLQMFPPLSLPCQDPSCMCVSFTRGATFSRKPWADCASRPHPGIAQHVQALMPRSPGKGPLPFYRGC